MEKTGSLHRLLVPRVVEEEEEDQLGENTVV